MYLRVRSGVKEEENVEEKDTTHLLKWLYIYCDYKKNRKY